MIIEQDTNTVSLVRIERVMTLINTIRSEPGLSAERLIDRTGISRRTFFRDIKLIQQSGVPLRHIAGQGYEIDPVHELESVRLNADELRGLSLASAVLATIADTPARSAAASALQAIERALPRGGQSTIARCGNILAVTASDAPPIDEDLARDLMLACEQSLPTTITTDDGVISGIPLALEPHRDGCSLYLESDQDEFLIVRVELAAMRARQCAETSRTSDWCAPNEDSAHWLVAIGPRHRFDAWIDAGATIDREGTVSGCDDTIAVRLRWSDGTTTVTHDLLAGLTLLRSDGPAHQLTASALRATSSSHA